jgi:hypothetical protein
LAKNRGWNTYGLSDRSTGDHAPYLKCPVHFYRELITDPRDSSVFICPECGLSSPYEENQLSHDFFTLDCHYRCSNSEKERASMQ